MSHLSVIQTKLVSGPHIARALRAMGYENAEVNDTPQHLRVMSGSTVQKAEIIVRRKELNLKQKRILGDVGFRKNETGSYDWIVTAEDRRRLGETWYNELSQRYAYYIVMDSLEKQGFDRVETQREEDQSIRIVMRRMV